MNKNLRIRSSLYVFLSILLFVSFNIGVQGTENTESQKKITLTGVIEEGYDDETDEPYLLLFDEKTFQSYSIQDGKEKEKLQKLVDRKVKIIGIASVDDSGKKSIEVSSFEVDNSYKPNIIDSVLEEADLLADEDNDEEFEEPPSGENNDSNIDIENDYEELPEDPTEEEDEPGYDEDES